MTTSSRQSGRSQIVRRLLSVGLIVFMGYGFGVFSLGGCGGSQEGGFRSAREHEQLPERMLDKLTDCGKQGPKPLGRMEYTVEFNVVVTEDGHVEDVQLRTSTLPLAEVEACMIHALYELSRPAEALSLWRRNLASDVALAPEARALVSQGAEPVELFALVGAAAATLVVGYVAYRVYVHYFVAQHHTKHRPHNAPPQTEEPPKPGKDTKPEPQGNSRTEDPTPPVPSLPPDCPRNESFSPIRTDNATGCTDKNGNVRCYSSKHHPCAGVHTHGKLSYQEIRNGVCKTVERKAVHCEGLFVVSGSCGSAPTVECKGGGPEISGTHEE